MSNYSDPTVWGPNYWFFLMTVATNYPKNANETTKKKYYDLISNLPLFIPHDKIADDFIKLLDKYPVTPYLDKRDSFIKWVHFIHNEINVSLGKEKITLKEALNKYYDFFKPKDIIISEQIKYRKKMIFTVIIISLGVGGYYLCKK